MARTAQSASPAKDPSRPRAPWGRLAGTLLLWWAWTPAVYGLGWCLRLITPGHRFAQSADQWFYVNYLVLGGWFWLWLTIGLAGSVVIALTALHGRGGRLYQVTVATIAAVLAIGAFAQAWRVAWDDDKDFARYYDRSAAFYAPALSSDTAPPSLARLLAGERSPAPLARAAAASVTCGGPPTCRGACGSEPCRRPGGMPG